MTVIMKLLDRAVLTFDFSQYNNKYLICIDKKLDQVCPTLTRIY